MQRFRGHVPWLVVAGAALLLFGGTTARYAQRTSAQAGTTVQYPAGWNLVAAPTGTLLDHTVGPAYAFGPDGSGYVAVGPGELIAGRAAWVYFAQDTTLTLGRSAAEFSRVIAPPERFILVGNPASAAVLPLAGADLALAYDATAGSYTAVSELAPGHGAWVLSHAGGDITLGKAPTGPAADEVRRLQTALTEKPTERANIDALGAVAGELVRGRQYAQVEAMLDDLLAAAEDGLHAAGSGALPSLSELQRSSGVGVREALARARDAAAAGDLGKADAEVRAAGQAAQAAADDGVSQAEAQLRGGMLAYSAQRQAPPGLAAFGALLRSAFFVTGLGAAPADPFWNLATAVLTQQAPVGPLPMVNEPAAAPTPTAAAVSCATGTCVFNGEGKGALPVSTDALYSVSLTFQLTVTNGQVSGQGQTTESASYDLSHPGGCAVPLTTGPLTITGTLSGTRLHLGFTAGSVTHTFVCGGVAQSTDTLSYLSLFGPVDVDAKDGATGSGGLAAGLNGTGGLTITLHQVRGP